MSHESRVTSHEVRTAELASEFSYINFRTIDFDDAFDLALAMTHEVLCELEEVEVTNDLKEQAAFCVGQYFLDGLALLETQNIAHDLSCVVGQVPKPFLIMVRTPDGVGVAQ